MLKGSKIAEVRGLSTDALVGGRYPTSRPLSLWETPSSILLSQACLLGSHNHNTIGGYSRLKEERPCIAMKTKRTHTDDSVD